MRVEKVQCRVFIQHNRGNMCKHISKYNQNHTFIVGEGYRLMCEQSGYFMFLLLYMFSEVFFAFSIFVAVWSNDCNLIDMNVHTSLFLLEISLLAVFPEFIYWKILYYNYFSGWYIYISMCQFGQKNYDLHSVVELSGNNWLGWSCWWKHYRLSWME